MSRLTGVLLALLAVGLVALRAVVLGAGRGRGARAVSDDDRTVRSSGARVFIGGGLRSGK